MGSCTSSDKSNDKNGKNKNSSSSKSNSSSKNANKLPRDLQKLFEHALSGDFEPIKNYIDESEKHKQLVKTTLHPETDRNLLMQACCQADNEEERIQLLKYLINLKIFDINAKSTSGDQLFPTALCFACLTKNPNAIASPSPSQQRQQQQRNPEPTATTSSSPALTAGTATSLITPSFPTSPPARNADICKLLLDNGADPTIPVSKDGKLFALNFACKVNFFEAVAVLLESDKYSKEHLTSVLVYLCRTSDNVQAAEMLVAKGADVDGGENVFQAAPLMYAVKFEHVEMVKFLLRHGADFASLQETFNSNFSHRPVPSVAGGLTTTPQSSTLSPTRKQQLLRRSSGHGSMRGLFPSQAEAFANTSANSGPSDEVKKFVMRPDKLGTTNGISGSATNKMTPTSSTTSAAVPLGTTFSYHLQDDLVNAKWFEDEIEHQREIKDGIRRRLTSTTTSRRGDSCNLNDSFFGGPTTTTTTTIERRPIEHRVCDAVFCGLPFALDCLIEGGYGALGSNKEYNECCVDFIHRASTRRLHGLANTSSRRAAEGSDTPMFTAAREGTFSLMLDDIHGGINESPPRMSLHTSHSFKMNPLGIAACWLGTKASIHLDDSLAFELCQRIIRSPNYENPSSSYQNTTSSSSPSCEGELISPLLLACANRTDSSRLVELLIEDGGFESQLAAATTTTDYFKNASGPSSIPYDKPLNALEIAYVFDNYFVFSYLLKEKGKHFANFDLSSLESLHPIDAKPANFAHAHKRKFIRRILGLELTDDEKLLLSDNRPRSDQYWISRLKRIKLGREKMTKKELEKEVKAFESKFLPKIKYENFSSAELSFLQYLDVKDPEEEPEDPAFDEDPVFVDMRQRLAHAMARSMKSVERVERELEGNIICLNGFHADLEVIFCLKRNLVHASEEEAQKIAQTVLENISKTRREQYLEKRKSLLCSSNQASEDRDEEE